MARYRILLEAVAGSEARAALEGAVALRDEVVVVLLARLLGDLHRRWAAGERTVGLLPMLPLASPLYSRPLRRPAPPAGARLGGGFLKALGDEQGILLVRLEQTELGVFRLFGLSSSDRAARSARPLSAGQHGGSRPDRRVLPAAPALAAGDQAGGGGAALRRRRLRLGRAPGKRGRSACPASWPTTRRSSPSALCPRSCSTTAISDPTRAHKRTHGILIDASASMRGSREVVARGLGLALARKLALLGGEVWLSFFDSRLHRRVEAAALGGRELPYLLCFRSEQGRNYARVFGELRDELARPGRDASGRQVAITIITHGECHIPVTVMQALRRHAAVYGIFVLAHPAARPGVPAPAVGTPDHLRRVDRPSGRAAPPGPGCGQRRGGQHARRRGAG